MNELIDKLGFWEVVVGIAGVLLAAATWLLGRFSKYKDSTKESEIKILETDSAQNSRLAKLEILVRRLEVDLATVKHDNELVERRIYASLSRLEQKIDRLYELKINENG